MSRQIRFLKILFVAMLIQAFIAGCTSQNLPVTATPTLIPSKTNTPVTLLQNTLIPITQIPEETPLPKPIIVYQSVSPDARWTAITSREFVEGQERSIFKVSNDGGRIEWEVENEIFIEEPPAGFWFPVPFYWSKDGKYLYYAHRASGDGCFGGNKHLGKDLARIDLTTGEVRQISPGGTYITISPDEKFLATFSYGREGITIQNLLNNESITLNLVVKQEDVGFEIDQRYITWSPDSNSLVFVIMAGVCDGAVESYFNWIVRVDMASFSQRLLTEKDEQRFVPISWLEKDKILVRDKDGILWWMNPDTGVTSSVK